MRTSMRAVCIVLADALLGGCQNHVESSVLGCTPPDNVQLDIPLDPQETGAWCWAASTQMVLASPPPFSSLSVTQCDVATKYFGAGADCCNTGPDGFPFGCVKGGLPPFDKYGYNSTTKKAALTWDQVKVQIGCRQHAFAFTWRWPSGGTHIMVATGYKTDGADQLVCVNDPLPMGEGQAYCHSYDEYVSGANHTHGDDYYNLVKKE